MVNFADYVMKKKDRGELTTGLVLYGETEPPEMQIENLWKIVHRRTGEDLADPRPDFDEFSSSDRMYPSMMKPEVKRRWDLKNYEWEETKAQHAKLKRMVHAQFMQENPNLPVVQGLQGTTYGSEIQSEFQKMLSGKQSVLKSRMPKTGTGRTIRDELERDNVDLNEIADEVVQFQTPKSRNTFAALGVDRDETLRIVGKILASAESSHALEYQYDDEGRLQVVNYAGKPVEVYRYNRMGQRVFSQVSGGQPLKYHYNEHGQLVQAGDETYSYDEDGYLAGKKNSHGLTRYRYLENGQLCGVQLPDGREIEYRFGENGFRAEKLTNGKLVQRYHWDDLITLSAVENKSGVIRFRYDEDGDAIGMIRNGQKLLLATDQLGTVFTVADLSGSSVQEVLYDSFGVMIQNSHPELALPLGFAGGLYDSDTGLIHFGYREYDPAIGRFISPDPLGYAGGDVDLYGYCGDDPVNFVDRLGLSDTSEASEDEEENSEESAENQKKPTQAKASSKSLLDRNINKIAEGRFGKDVAKYADDYRRRSKPGEPIDEVHMYHSNGTFEVRHKDGTSETYEVTSGKPGETDQSKKNKGPLPKGEYEFDPKEASTVEGWKFLGRSRSGDWGHGRVPLHPSKDTKTHGQDGFYIHGGKLKGSAGCADIGDNDREFFRSVGKTKKKVKVTVH